VNCETNKQPLSGQSNFKRVPSQAAIESDRGTGMCNFQLNSGQPVHKDSDSRQ